MNIWLTDANGNRCSVEYWGSRESAHAALDSLKNCKNCTNCSGCSGCSRCSRCSRCSGCSGCSGCSHIAYLFDKKNVIAVPPPEGQQIGAPAIPKIENIHAKVFEAVSQPNALDMGSWHTCNTTHCRAGWVVHLAGKAGYALERFHNTALAAQLIYRESGYPINPCRFYDSDGDALADMKRLATPEAV